MEKQDSEEVYFDSHNHLLFFPQQQRQQVLEEAISHGVRFVAPNCTCQQDYQPMLNLAQSYPYLAQHHQMFQVQQQHHQPSLPLMSKGLQIIPSFGVHPWYTQRQKDNKEWLSTLEKVLKQKEHYGVGQIGLDLRTAILEQNSSKEEQQDFFIKQLELSFLLNRTVSVHCVHAWGPMLKLFKKYNTLFSTPLHDNGLSPHQRHLIENYKGNPIIMHAYNGSKESTKALIKLKQLNIYFSLGLRSAFDLATIVPIDRLVLQTDAPSLCNYQLLVEEEIIKHEPQADPALQKKKQAQWQNRVSYISASARPLSQMYKMDRSQFLRAVFTNSLRAFRLLK